MPIQKAPVSQSSREASPRRNSHSPSRPVGMGNRPLAPSAPPGKPRQPSLHRLTRKTGINRQAGDQALQKKSSLGGSMTTVGEMIPFQRASRREPHIQAPSLERDRGESRRKPLKTPPRKGSSDISNTTEGRTHNDTQKVGPADGTQPQARSVRPKLKRPSLPPEQISSRPASNSVGAYRSSQNRKADGKDVLIKSSTSPRRRIVKQKSQTSSSRKENEDSHTTGPSSVPSTVIENSMIDSHHSLENIVNSQETPSLQVLGNSESSRPASVSRAHHINRSLPESQTRPVNDVRNNIEDAVSLSLGNDNQSSHESHSRPPSSVRGPLNNNLSRSGLGSGRRTIQPSIASATDMHEPSNTSLTGNPERIPNSARRRLERSRTDDSAHSAEETGLIRNSLSNLTPRARPRETIDVSASVLERRSPPLSTVPSASLRNNNRPDTTLSRQDLSSDREDIWVPQRRTEGVSSGSASSGQNQSSLRSRPRLQESTLPLRASRITGSPDVVFRESPVADISPRMSSQVTASPENENLPSVTSNTSRNISSMPSRRGLYRALSVSENSNSNPNASALSRLDSTSRASSYLDNIDDDDMASWRQIESEHSYHPREANMSRQRLINQDRARGHDTILTRNASGRRIAPPAAREPPVFFNDQAFPPLGGSRLNSSSMTTAELGRRSRQGQSVAGSGEDTEFRARNRRNETPPPTPSPGNNPESERSSEASDEMVEHLVLLASPIFGPLMLQASPAVLFNMLSRARRDFGGEFVELLIENVVLSLLAQHTFDVTHHAQNNSGAPPPASEETIKSLEKVTVTKQMVSEEAFCAICHGEYVMDETLDQLPCKHNFHNQCIAVWLKKSGTCPVCRHKLYAEAIG